MIELKFSITGNLDKKIGLLDVKLIKAIGSAIKKSAFVVQGSARRLIQKGKRTGRLYRRGTISHQSSRAGEPPKSDTGRLVNSIHINHFVLGADIGSDLKYSSMLEGGASKMEPRPWLQRSLDQSKAEIDRIIKAALEKALK